MKWMGKHSAMDCRRGWPVSSQALKRTVNPNILSWRGSPFSTTRVNSSPAPSVLKKTQNSTKLPKSPLNTTRHQENQKISELKIESFKSYVDCVNQKLLYTTRLSRSQRMADGQLVEIYHDEIAGGPAGGGEAYLTGVEQNLESLASNDYSQFKSSSRRESKYRNQKLITEYDNLSQGQISTLSKNITSAKHFNKRSKYGEIQNKSNQETINTIDARKSEKTPHISTLNLLKNNTSR